MMPLVDLLNPCVNLVRAAFPWVKPGTINTFGGAKLDTRLDSEIRLEIHLGPNNKTAQAAMYSTTNPPLCDPLEDELDPSEWTDFQGWVAVAKALYAETRNRVPLVFTCPVRAHLPAHSSLGPGQLELQPGEVIWVRPHSGMVKVDSIQGWVTVDDLRLFHSFLATPLQAANRLGGTVTRDGIITREFKNSTSTRNRIASTQLNPETFEFGDELADPLTFEVKL